MKEIIVLLLLFFFTCVYSQEVIYVGDTGSNVLISLDENGDFLKTIDPDINTPNSIKTDADKGLVFYINASEDQRSIRYYNIYTEFINTIYYGFDQAMFMDISRSEKIIFISETALGAIYTLPYSGGNLSLLTDKLDTPVDISYDEIHEKLFMVENFERISKINRDGTGYEVVISGLDYVNRIVVDPLNELIYFSQGGSTPAISKIGYNGNNKETVIETNQTVRSIDLDCAAQKIWFTVKEGEFLASVALDGTDYKTYPQDFGVIAHVQVLNNEPCPLISSISNEPFADVTDINVAPNPFVSFVQLKSNSEQIEKVEIFSITGRELSSIDQIMNKQVKLDLSGVQEGVLILSVYMSNGAYQNLRLFKLNPRI
jgi:hypothetical protein